MRIPPQDIVAIMLASAILMFILGSIVQMLLTVGPGYVQSEHVADLWADIIKVTLGGLIGYMSAKTGE